MKRYVNMFSLVIAENQLPTNTGETEEVTQGCVSVQCQDSISGDHDPRRCSSNPGVRRMLQGESWCLVNTNTTTTTITNIIISGVNDKVEFPPDKDDTALDSPEPDRPMTSPVRQRHRLVQHHQGVGGYSTGYTSSSSEDSRSSRSSTLPSLHHSYETLNISDTGVIISHPHRPAPKPPGADTSLCRLCILVTQAVNCIQMIHHQAEMCL